MKPSRRYCLTLVAISGVIFAMGATQQPPAPPAREAVVTTEGTGYVTKDPDTASLTFGAEAEAPTGPAAQSAVAIKISKVIAAVRAAGIEEKHIWTTYAALEPVYEEPKPGTQDRDAPRKLIGYRAANRIKVELKRMDGIGAIIDRGVEAGATEFNGPYFELADENPARDEGIALAVANARRQAEAIAKALGMRLGEVLEAGDPNIGSRGGTSYFSMASAQKAERIPDTPIVPERVSVSATVKVKWRLMPAN